MDNNAKRWRFITINKNMLVTNFSMYFTFLLFFFSTLKSLNSIHHYASMRRGLRKVRKVWKFLSEVLASRVNEARSGVPWVI